MTTHTGFPLTLDGETFTEAEFTANGGTAYKDRLPQMMTAGVADVGGKVSAAAAHVASALAYASQAALSAVTAVNAPGTSATSASSMALGNGAKSLTVQPGKNFAIGMNIIVARTADPTAKRGAGIVTAYNSGTGVLDFTLTTTATGTYTDWTVSLAGEPSSGGISTVATASTSTTLTGVATLLRTTPTSYGMRVTLPDATTCPEGGPLHIIDNSAGAYPVLVTDSTGALKGFVFPGVVSHVSLYDNATAAGTWVIENGEVVGASAQLQTANMQTVDACIALDSDREFLLGQGGTGGQTYGVVYRKSTNQFGAVTLIRNAAVSGKHAAILQATNQVLVVSFVTNAFEAVICSVNPATDAITPNTAATASTGAEIIVAFAEGCGLVAVTGGFVTSYSVTTTDFELRGITVSGVAVALSAAVGLDGASGGLIVASGDKVIAASTYMTHLYTRPYTLSAGPTLTPGTGTDTNSGTMTLNKFFALGTRWCVLYNDGGSTVKGGIVSLSGTTTTISAATLHSAGTLRDAIVVNGKVLTLNNQTTNNANLLTDSAGTASAGTAITTTSTMGASGVCLYANSTNATICGGTTAQHLFVIDCSGSSPVTSQRKIGTVVNNATIAASFEASNSVLTRSENAVYAGRFAQRILVNTSLPYQARVSRDEYSLRTLEGYHYQGSTAGTWYRGGADSERWWSAADNTATGCIVKVECVA